MADESEWSVLYKCASCHVRLFKLVAILALELCSTISISSGEPVISADRFSPGFPRWLGFWLTSRPAFGRKIRTLRGERWLLLLSPVTSDVVRPPVSG